jgi:hypothetical protein
MIALKKFNGRENLFGSRLRLLAIKFLRATSALQRNSSATTRREEREEEAIDRRDVHSGRLTGIILLPEYATLMIIPRNMCLSSSWADGVVTSSG